MSDTQSVLTELEKLIEETNHKIDGLKGYRSGLELAIDILSKDVSDQHASSQHYLQPYRQQQRPESMKRVLLRYLGEFGQEGLSPLDAVEQAQAEGFELRRASVSSLLSRFKRDGVVMHVNGRYRFPTHIPRAT